jgi:hypothetical protein
MREIRDRRRAPAWGELHGESADPAVFGGVEWE